MPKKQNRDWFRIPVDVTEALATLADSTGLIQALTTAVLEYDARVTSAELTYTLTDIDIGETTIAMYIAAGDYSTAEIEEYIELTGLLGPGNKVEKEVAGRFVRHIGTFPAGTATGEDVALNLGEPVKTRLNWLVPDGRTLNMFSYNNTGAQLTGGEIVRVMGHLNGFWQY